MHTTVASAVRAHVVAPHTRCNINVPLKAESFGPMLSPVPQGMECEDSEYSGIRTRQLCGFFAPAPCVMAGRATDTTPRKGKEVHRLCSVFNLPATRRRRVKTIPPSYKTRTGVAL